MKIKINNNSWNIEELESNNSLLYIGNQNCRGTTHYFHQSIYLDNSLKVDSMYNTLCHELAHAFLHDTQITQTTKFDEEMLCEFVGLYGKQIVEISDEYFRNRKGK